MNTNHYPSLELCKKLTEIGFPDPYCHFVREKDGTYDYSFGPWNYVDEGASYVCPSVMEMLDVMPDTIQQDFLLNFWKNNDKQYGVVYEDVDGTQIGESGKGFETLPNALAEMILWLHENKYITFPTL